MLRKNNQIILEIGDMSSDGLGVGRHDGQVVFVPGTAPGDVIKAHIVKPGTSHAFAIVSELLQPSEIRRTVDCGAFGRCGGCAYRHIKYEHQLEIKLRQTAETLKRIGGTDITPSRIIPSPKSERYRNKSETPFGTTSDGEIYLGFFAKRSHKVIKTTDCLLTPRVFSDIQAAILEFANNRKLSVYDEIEGKGLLRHLFLRYGESTGEIMVCFVINGQALPFEGELTETLTANFPGIKSIYININTKKTNLILGDSYRLIYGNATITDEICGLKIKISPGSFYQVNRGAAELLYNAAAAMAALRGYETLTDLYCGIGTIGLSMAGQCKMMIGIEQNADAVANAEENARLNAVENARFYLSDAGEKNSFSLMYSLCPDVIVLDPPRKGLSKDLIQFLTTLRTERIVYISCAPATLARDCKLLSEKGFAVEEALAVDMFPYSSHVEAVVLLSGQ